ncbi:BglG family transcription antiterminator [Fusobacterium sp.]|uniref:BglG family transcription antiterminator n=1 Tax=Fusobacterium sp. TaxID=68766 RepID=UPI00290480CB|nr:PRD domain-containing protein [Fusobacterium sp.]MDU1910346.1 PRD domain-containing protein [Fusobacterium sp.]
MALNKKHFEILKELKKEDDLKRIANIFNQTERSIRYKIAELNENLGQEKIFIKKRKIFCLLDEKDISSLIKGLNEYNYIYEQKERIDLLILESILQKDEFQIEELADLLQISKSTLRGDIKILSSKLSKMGIYLEQYQDNNKKCHLNYKNSDLIYYLAIFLYEYVIFDEGDKRISFKNTSYFEKMVSEKLTKQYLEVLEDSYQKIKNTDLPYIDETLNLLILLISVLKLRNLNTEELDVLNKKVLKETREFKILQKTFVEFSETQLYFLTDYLLRISCDEEEIFSKHRNWLEIELGVYRLIKEFEHLKKVQLVKNKRLLDDILYYIKPLIYRSSKKIELKNSVLKEVKMLYEDTFYYLKKAFHSFEVLLNLEVSDNEIGFLVPIFEVALRNQIKQAKKIIVVSSYKRNLTNFLLARLEEEFLVDIVKVIYVKQLDKIQEEEIDLLVTTSNLTQKNLPYPVCQVNPILTDADKIHLKEFGLQNQDKKIPLEKLMGLIERNIENENWNENKLREELLHTFPHNILDEREREVQEELQISKNLRTSICAFEWREAVRAGMEILWKQKYIKKSYMEDSVNKKEEDSLIFFLNEKTALFYTEPKENVIKIGFSLVEVRHPLLIRGKKIKYIVCFAPKGDAEDQSLLFQLNDYFEEEGIEQKLKKYFK